MPKHRMETAVKETQLRIPTLPRKNVSKGSQRNKALMQDLNGIRIMNISSGGLEQRINVQSQTRHSECL